MIRREVKVDWRETIDDLYAAGMTLDGICGALIDRGVMVCRSSIWNIKRGRVSGPRYEVGAALLNLLDERTLRRTE